MEQDNDIELEQALALGFNSIKQMREHEEWLQKNGSKAYHQWLKNLKGLQ